MLKKINDSQNNNFAIKVEECNDGLECLIKLLKRSLNGNLYDLVILDDEMMYLDGSELYKIIDYIVKGRLGKQKVFDCTIFDSFLLCSANTDNLINKINNNSFLNNIKAKPLGESDIRNFLIEKLTKMSD